MATKKQKENVQKLQQMIQFVSNTLSNIENNLKRAQGIMKQIEKFDPYDESSIERLNEMYTQNVTTTKSDSDEDTQSIIHGSFNGQLMIGEDQKKYPVPLNYASKTKLIPGDKLKLTIKKDGKLIYKLVAPAERAHQKAIISISDEQKFIAITDNQKIYFLNQAAVSYYQGTPGDEIYIITNAEEEGAYAAIEAVIKA